MNLMNRKGEPWNKEIEDTSPEDLLGMLKKHSQKPVLYIEDILFKNKPLRNAFSHGLFRYENEMICWVDNINSPESHSKPFIEFIQIVREQSMFTQCFLWVGAKLISEGFFEP